MVDARPRWRKKRYVVGALAVLLVTFAFANNTQLFTAAGPEGPKLLAHRGVAQTFSTEGVANDTCTAERIDPPVHGYLENTVPSMRAAFDAGADLVELDVHPTRDGQFAVFHDWELDCRTDGTGTTRDLTMAELKALDIGHGYTADGGRTFPFRGRGVGLMPSLDEVLAAFPREPLLIHVKSDDPAEGAALAERLSALDASRLENIAVYGGDAPVRVVRERLPQIRTMSKGIMVDCLLQYEAVGWTGAVPAACANTELHIPESYAPWLWAWPSEFVSRMESAGSRVVLVAGSGGFSEGFDTPESLTRIPAGFTGYVWTNRIAEVAPLISR
ncbi:glycerophosphoryl diester phosphodiesterase [Saccharopolyspora antimicrobica]|uniref:Glycerophosphoryl diester phosphodiesterase n=1 Tax=Saccharopolyspora antimicrobica TaxID=455193 RepID=A0A1I5FQ41_9PSEU|nr:glycerophosphodiester phosphodiesterase family protein [Saccharopolyspora antimicrobica]RKT82266.1 glycerophosphoryl diester phosphodiesterase [Saccharopolyspora antimicrobica]SFO25900.1 glycerophosphoryl diester phosphodiesterase [Saccharopolyspora antimicrobica]